MPVPSRVGMPRRGPDGERQGVPGVLVREESAGDRAKVGSLRRAIVETVGSASSRQLWHTSGAGFQESHVVGLGGGVDAKYLFTVKSWPSLRC